MNTNKKGFFLNLLHYVLPMKKRFALWCNQAGLKSYAQYKQDLFVLFYYEQIYRDWQGRELFFVDIGANDGISLSNTYLLENNTKIQWGGGAYRSR